MDPDEIGGPHDGSLPPEVFSLSEVVLSAHVALAHRLRETSAEQERTCRLLRSFVPGIVREDVASPGAGRRARDATGALLFADASGFTALTQSLCADKDGAETLTTILNEFFGVRDATSLPKKNMIPTQVLIELIDDHGGDVVQFSGDALTVLWRVGAAGEAGQSATLADAVALAAACALSMQRAIRDDARLSGGPLTMHMGLGAGAMVLAHLGGVWGRWVFVLDGPAMTQISVAEPLAGSGEIVLSPEAVDASVQETPSISLQHDFVRVDVSEFCVQISRTRAEMINGPRSSRIDWNPTEIRASKVEKPRVFSGFPGH